MFIGHFAAGMAAKKIQPSISLGVLFVAAQFLDLLWPTLLLLGIEHVRISPGISSVTPLDFFDYPVSHSLAIVLVWSLLFAGVYYGVTRNRSGALLLGGLVLSHWVLDLIVHIPDLPLYPGDSPKVGFGLWDSMTLTVVVEGIVFVAGIMLYVSARRESGLKISWWFWSMIIFFIIIHIANLTGPPPPNVSAIAWAGHLQWLFIPWAWWADRNRRAV